MEHTKIKLMTHVVVGYPDLGVTEKLIELMFGYGVRRIELQIPFSDTLADGPIIMHANEGALSTDVTTEVCLSFVQKMCHKFPDIEFYVMTYYQKIFHCGLFKFIDAVATCGVTGLIVPDLPFDAPDMAVMKTALSTTSLDLIPVVSTGMTEDRLKRCFRSRSHRFIYLTAQHGTTGMHTQNRYLQLGENVQRIRQFSSHKVEVGVGFGIKTRTDVYNVCKYADFAVIGSATIHAYDTDGVSGVAEYLKQITA